ncbi:MAG TPA: hypothetical protein VLJ76_07765 [Gaiellaceae bacterium]|nr:hypothetical protein [Gaiellaceae bacterium]
MNCETTIFYDVNEATGGAVLSQLYPVKLRTPRLPRGVAYEVDCLDPLILELPAAAGSLRAQAGRVSLPVRAGSPLLAGGKRLRADPGSRLVTVDWPASLPSGDVAVRLTFTLPKARSFREKAVYAASVSCGRERYAAPILPAVSRMAQVPSVGVSTAALTTSFTIPRISQASATVMLSCRR